MINSRYYAKTGVLMIMCFVMLPSCVKYHEVCKTEFPQGKEKGIKKDLALRNIRSARVYDEFQTEAIFDALYLSGEVRKYYVDAYTERRGKDKQFAESMLMRGLEENKHWVSFYILAYVPKGIGGMMSDNDPSWSVYLVLPSGERVAPRQLENLGIVDTEQVSSESIKEADLAPEYAALFGHRANQFKTVYFAKFPAKGFNNSASYPQETIKLVFGSVYRSVEMSWGGRPEECKKLSKHVLITKREEKQYGDSYWL